MANERSQARIEAARALEWPRFLELASHKAITEPGRSLVLGWNDPSGWAPDSATSRLRQQETLEITPLIDRDGLWAPLQDVLSPDSALDRLARGAVLDGPDFTLLRKWLYAIEAWSQLPREEIRGELVKKALALLPDPFEPLRILEKILTPEGELSERASPRLASLHAEIRGLRREISQVLERVMKDLARAGVLQEEYSDVRDGRFVLPVKISAQNEVEGTLYEASASRQTVFIEPREISPLNNRLRQRQNELSQEIFNILSETSKRIQPFGPEIATGARILAHWDAVCARARLGRQYSGKPITVTDERRFELRQTAHPLLWWSLAPDQIIRNEIDFADPARTLLLTGPNTGGKTVLLKTLGLAGLCARTGFPFPATDQPVVPFFDEFFADLGDPQSIEAHLSSFSGHVLRLRDILDRLSERSLVLLDELNSATDPEEGAALGRAFMETVMTRGALTVATTHDPHLKALAFSDERIVNASMAFDEGSRIPTYRLVIGVPGRSRALETAERLGIPAQVLTLARSYLTREHTKFESLLARLERDVQEATRSRNQAVAAREEAERLRKEWTERTESSVNEMLEKTRQKLRRILEQAQDEVRSSVRKLDEMRSRREIDTTRAHLNEAVSLAATRLESALEEEAPEIAETLQAKAATTPSKAPELTPTLEPGVQVRVPKWKSLGRILEIQGTRAKVAMGRIQMSLSLDDIEPLSALELRKMAPSAPASRPAPANLADFAPDSQLDLRGKRFEEAMSELESYLDLVFRNGQLLEVVIIHGLGTGAIREGTRKLLKQLPYVKTYQDAGPGQGGSGATRVEFDR